MSDPLALLPFAMAAANRRVHGVDVSALIAAGVTLLQRSASLVRALAERRPALLLPHGPAFVTALAACDGHTALVLDADASADEIARQLDTGGAGVVFTLEALEAGLPAGASVVRLDDVPRSAVVRIGTDMRQVDLGSHVGLALEGETGVAGSDEPVLAWVRGGAEVTVSHREVMTAEATADWPAAVCRLRELL